MMDEFYLALSCLLLILCVYQLQAWLDVEAFIHRIKDGVANMLMIAAQHKRTSRQSKQSISLMDASEMIDIVKLGLSAGLSFDAALDAYCMQCDSALASLFDAAHMSWIVGTSTRREALLQAARKSGVEELNAFVVAVLQALEFGAPVVDVLDQQSEQMRKAYKAAIEHKIEQVPIKILIPTATLVLPALLLAIMGPLSASNSFF